MSQHAVGSTAAVLLPRLERLFDALTAANVDWSLLRHRDTLGLPEGDIDVLVDPQDLGRAGEVLGEEGFAAVPAPLPDLHAVDYDEASGRFLWVHVQAALSLAGSSVPAADVLADATPGRLPQPSDPWLLWILLLHGIIDKGGIAPRHRPHVMSLAKQALPAPRALEAIATHHGLVPSRVLPLAARGDWPALEQPFAQPPLRSGRARLAGRVRRLRRSRGAPGFSLAVIGPDGAGKTTLVEALHERLPFPTSLRYMGLTGGRIPRADSLRIPGLVLTGRLVILWARYLRAASDQRLGRIVLFDRYTLDGSVPSGVPLRPLARLSRRVQRHACPTPDLVLLLDASGTTMHGRKGEYDAATLEDWRTAYARLAGVIAELEIIDAEQSVDAVRRQAEVAIWRRYRPRLEAGTR